MERPLKDVVVFAPLGSNPALLSAFVWALRRQDGLRTVEAHVVVVDKGRGYIAREFTAPGAALDQLHAVMPDVLPREGLVEHVARRSDGSVVADDEDDTDARIYQDAVVLAARQALDRAGDLPVVFALLGGRRRTMTVMASVAAQYFARPHDLLMDLRITPQSAMKPGAFFFPEQRARMFRAADGSVLDVREVAVWAVEVRVPRLAGLLRGEIPSGYNSLLATGQDAIDALAPVELEIDLTVDRGVLRVIDANGTVLEELKPGPVECLWLACLIEHRDWLAPPKADDHAHPFANAVRSVFWTAGLKHLAICYYRNPGSLDWHDGAESPFRTQRSQALAVLRRLEGKGDARFAELVPELERGPTARQRFRGRGRVMWPRL
jgi:CRISPR-associated protein (TIGR02584 family)